jgi:hypothetical protein
MESDTGQRVTLKPFYDSEHHIVNKMLPVINGKAFKRNYFFIVEAMQGFF